MVAKQEPMVEGSKPCFMIKKPRPVGLWPVNTICQSDELYEFLSGRNSLIDCVYTAVFIGYFIVAISSNAQARLRKSDQFRSSRTSVYDCSRSCSQVSSPSESWTVRHSPSDARNSLAWPGFRTSSFKINTLPCGNLFLALVIQWA